MRVVFMSSIALLVGSATGLKAPPQLPAWLGESLGKAAKAHRNVTTEKKRQNPDDLAVLTMGFCWGLCGPVGDVCHGDYEWDEGMCSRLCTPVGDHCTAAKNGDHLAVWDDIQDDVMRCMAKCDVMPDSCVVPGCYEGCSGMLHEVIDDDQ